MESLIGFDALERQLATNDCALLDASHHLPATGRDAAVEFAVAHIEGARFLDLSGLTDTASSVPVAMATRDQFAARMAAIGVEPGTPLVFYDDSAIHTACRAWLTARAAGWQDVAVLDGPFALWRAQGRAVASGASQAGLAPEGDTTLRPLTCTISEVAGMIGNGDAPQLVDARDEGRFTGETVDHVHGLPGGHIPGARNLPYTLLFHEDGRWKDRDAIAAAFTGAGLDLSRPIVAYCGSGMTASVLIFALHLLGHEDARLYDGSWSEWGADPDAPIETGAAR